MKLLDIIQAAGARISGGDPYLWECYGPNANFLEFRTAQGQGYCHCVFDTKTYDVYYVYVEIPGKNQCWQWNNPSYIEAYLDECERRKVDPYEAYDDVKWTPILATKELLDKVEDIGINH